MSADFGSTVNIPNIVFFSLWDITAITEKPFNDTSRPKTVDLGFARQGEKFAEEFVGLKRPLGGGMCINEHDRKHIYARTIRKLMVVKLMNIF